MKLNKESEVIMKKRKYESPYTKCVEVELENGVMMDASVYEGGTKNAEGVTIEEHGFANPDKAWEGDYSGIGWDN